MRSTKIAVLKAATHHRSGSPVPEAFCLCDYELNASVNDPRLWLKKAVCEGT